jgi:hypothetical protein
LPRRSRHSPDDEKTRQEKRSTRARRVCWEFLWRETDATGKRVRRTTVIGTVEQYPTRDLARAATNGLRIQLNEERNRHPGHYILIADLVDHYVQTERSVQTDRHSHATRIVYGEFLKRWVRPHWADVNVCSARTMAVENWLRRLQVSICRWHPTGRHD